MRHLIWIPLLLAFSHQDDDGVPKDVRGFNGQITGVVKSKTDNDGMMFKVSRVTRVWKNNKASNIEWFLGRTIRIEANWVEGDDGKHHQVKAHLRFIKSAKNGEDYRLEIRHLEGPVFGLTELSDDQRESKPDKDRREQSWEIPKNLRGFSGQVTGIVSRKLDDGGFLFKVSKVTEVWKDNKAEKAKSLAGRTIRVGPGWEKGDDGKWHKIKMHARFIKKMKKGDDFRLEVKNVEGSHFAILELNEEQREWTKKDKDYK